MFGTSGLLGTLYYRAGGIVLGPSPPSPPSPRMFCFISQLLLKASFLKLGMCNISKNNIAKMFLDFF